MSAIVLFEDDGVSNFFPLTYWRSIFELPVGRHLLLDRTAQRLGLPISGIWTRDWIAGVAALRCGAPVNVPVGSSTLLINGRWVFDEPIEFPARPCLGMIDGEIAFVVCDRELATRFTPQVMLDPVARNEAIKGVEQVATAGRLLRYPWEIIAQLSDCLTHDWQGGDATIEADLDPRCCVEARDRVHIGLCTVVHPTAVIDARSGPIVISHDVAIGAYSVIEGPAYIGPGSRINPHAWLHGGNAIGPVCRVGGEVHGCVLCGYTNKHHNGFLGHAYVGSWVNLGAGSNNSDLKNTYGPIRVTLHNTSVQTHLTFFGAIIGDHAKIGINASIPTGAVIGFAATVATSRVLAPFTPSFAWITEEGVGDGDPARLLDVAARVMARRHVDLTDAEVELFFELGTRARGK